MTALAPYANRRSSEVPHYGEFPAHWDLRRLQWLAGERDVPNRGMDEQNLLSLSFGRIRRKDLHALEGLLPASFETYNCVRAGDVVFRLTDLQNDKRSLRSGLVTEDGIITRAYVTVAPVMMHAPFLAYAARDLDQRKVFYALGGGLRQSMGFDDLKLVEFVVPPHDEQRQIAEFLDYETGEIDAFIADQERLIDLLTERRRAALTHELSSTGREGWHTTTLRRLNPRSESGVSVNGSTSRPAVALEVGVLKTGAASKGFFDPTENKLVTEQEEIDRVACPVRGDRVLVTRANTPLLVGTAAYVPDDCPNLYLSDKLWQIDFGPWTRYLAWWMHTSMYTDQAQLYGSGASPTMYNLAYSDFRRFEVTLPPEGERSSIIERIEAQMAETDEALEDAREAIALSRERRAALISAAVTGQIDVRGWRHPAGRAS